jgi:predicted enzyme related to lactoylglutathione lyase
VITGIEHFAVVTTDVEKAAKFYKEVLGFKETHRLETAHSGTIIFISLGGTELELFGGGEITPKPAGRKVGYTHIALTVNDIDADYDRIRKHGVEFTMKPTSVESGMRIAFFADPDGNTLELMQRPK